MSPKAIAFKPTGRTVNQRLKEFGELGRRVCRRAFPLIDFDEDIWDVTEFCRTSRNVKLSLYFIQYEDSVRGRGTNSKNRQYTPMLQPFRDFAKAYALYTQQFKPRCDFGVGARLPAFWALEKALRDSTGRAMIQDLSPFVCDTASNLLKQRYTGSAINSSNEQLQLMVQYACENRLVSAPFQWEHKIPAYLHSPKRRMDREGQKLLIEDLPKDHELEAVCRIFFTAIEPRDVLPSGLCMFLISAPNRINEPLSLKARFKDCFVEESEGEETRLWWRNFPGSKNASDIDKQIPLNLAPYVRDAFEKIRIITEPARNVAKWYEEHPGQMFLPSGMEHYRRQKWLTTSDVQAILSLPTANAATTFIYRHCHSLCAKDGKFLKIPFAAIEQSILSMLPRGFQKPKAGVIPFKHKARSLKYSEALFVTLYNQMDPGAFTNPLVFREYSQAQFGHALGGYANGKSMFERQDPPLTQPDGSRIKIRSHQFRALAITEPIKGRASFASVRRYANHANSRHTPVYFRPDEDWFKAQAEETMALAQNSKFLFGPPVSQIHRTNEPLEDWELDDILMDHSVRHRTPYGGCGRALAVHPCQRFLDCLNCNSWFCVKGDKASNDQIRAMLVDVESQLAAMEEEQAQGSFGADRHLEWLTDTQPRLRELVAVFDDPRIPVGTVIVFRHLEEFSFLSMAIQDRLDQLGFKDRKILMLSEKPNDLDKEKEDDGRSS